MKKSNILLFAMVILLSLTGCQLDRRVITSRVPYSAFINVLQNLCCTSHPVEVKWLSQGCRELLYKSGKNSSIRNW